MEIQATITYEVRRGWCICNLHRPSTQVEHIIYEKDIQTRFKNMGVKSLSISSESVDAEADFTSTSNYTRELTQQQHQHIKPDSKKPVLQVKEERHNSHFLSSFVWFRGYNRKNHIYIYT